MIRDLLSLLSLLSQARRLNLWPALASRRPQKKTLSIYLYRDGGRDRDMAALTIGTIATIALTAASLSRQSAAAHPRFSASFPPIDPDGALMKQPRARVFRSLCARARALVRFGHLKALAW